MKWLIGIAGAIVVFLLINKQKANASPTQSEGLQPLPAPAVPSPTLCQGAVTLGGAAVGAYYGVPPSVTLPVGAGVSGPLCKMGGQVANAVSPYAAKLGEKIEKDTKATFAFGVNVGKTSVQSVNTLVQAQLNVAKSVTSPSKFVDASVDLTKKSVTVPVKATVSVAKAGVSAAKKLNPFSW